MNDEIFLLLASQTTKPKLRTGNFAFKAETKVTRELELLDFHTWLGYNQQEGSVAATVQKCAEFVKFCKHKCPHYNRFVIYY